MKNKKLDISVVVCTYKRSILLKNCLKSLVNQSMSRNYEIIVVDNDAEESAKDIVNTFYSEVSKHGIHLHYLIEPEQNIALARNRGVVACKGEYIAIIDDDEYAAEDWLENLFNTLVKYNADGVFGPVHPVFPESFPKWMIRSPLFKASKRHTGQKIVGTSAATNNAFLTSVVLKSRPGPFDRTYGRTGGEDTELFNYLEKKGYFFVWCNEAVVYEIQEETRISLKWHLKRGYRGGWGYAARTFREKSLFKASLLILFKSLGGTLKSIYNALSCYCNPKAALFLFFRDFSGQIGKIGFLIGVKLEEYKRRK
ncbi:hypothetical protein ES703_82481 [subsurface metagenome]